MNEEDFQNWKIKKENLNQKKLRINIKETAEKLYDKKKISKNLFSNLKILPIDE